MEGVWGAIVFWVFWVGGWILGWDLRGWGYSLANRVNAIDPYGIFRCPENKWAIGPNLVLGFQR